jgi:hypothetical protein
MSEYFTAEEKKSFERFRSGDLQAFQKTLNDRLQEKEQHSSHQDFVIEMLKEELHRAKTSQMRAEALITAQQREVDDLQEQLEEKEAEIRSQKIIIEELQGKLDRDSFAHDAVEQTKQQVETAVKMMHTLVESETEGVKLHVVLRDQTKEIERLKQLLGLVASIVEGKAQAYLQKVETSSQEGKDEDDVEEEENVKEDEEGE